MLALYHAFDLGLERRDLQLTRTRNRRLLSHLGLRACLALARTLARALVRAALIRAALIRAALIRAALIGAALTRAALALAHACLAHASLARASLARAGLGPAILAGESSQSEGRHLELAFLDRHRLFLFVGAKAADGTAAAKLNRREALEIAAFDGSDGCEGRESPLERADLFARR